VRGSLSTQGVFKMDGLEELHILVVDDEKIIRDGAQRILIKEGWDATTVENGERGLERLKEDSFQILLLDLMMPGIGGMEVLKKARETHPNLLVIVITGYATIENAVDAMKNGAYDFIPKPFTPDQLRIVIRRALDKLSLEREAELLRRERAQSLKDIAAEKSRTLTIINHMADGVVVTDRKGVVVLHNPAVADMLGLEEESSQGKTFSQWAGNDHLSEMLGKVLSMKGAATKKISGEIAWGDPPKNFFMAHSSPVCSEQGDILGSVTIFHDITWLKELDRMKSDFVDMVSHELRSPLGSIQQQLYTVVGGQRGEVNEEQAKTLSRVQDRINGLLGMIKNLLDLSRIETGRLLEQKEEIHLAEIIKEAVELTKVDAEVKGLKFEVEIDLKLFPIHADRQGVEIIVANLLNNAIKYNREGGRVCINVQNQGECVEVKVSDTGVGVKEENLPRIFDRFYRVRDEYTRMVIGSGLGLPLVKSIVEAHSGTITVASEQHKGTTFTVTLPRSIL
jgi:two-component system phosphate regulon sensor histidine kinase PhoR